jgi:hypothetical protein
MPRRKNKKELRMDLLLMRARDCSSWEELFKRSLKEKNCQTLEFAAYSSFFHSLLLQATSLLATAD